jgi:hypothetical protein
VWGQVRSAKRRTVPRDAVSSRKVGAAEQGDEADEAGASDGASQLIPSVRRLPEGPRGTRPICMSTIMRDSLRRLREPLVGGLAVAVVHYCAFWACFLVGFTLAMHEFENGPTAWGSLERAFAASSELLAAPIGSILFRSPSRGLSSLQQHALLAGNSLVWGVAAALALWVLRRAATRRV